MVTFFIMINTEGRLFFVDNVNSLMMGGNIRVSELLVRVLIRVISKFRCGIIMVIVFINI